ncbi:MAG: M18 family aminopeptidase [Halieaceae bacterium]
MSQQDFNAALCDFIARATTPFHAVAAMTAQLRDAGFVALAEERDIKDLASGGKYYLTRNDSSLVAFVVGSERAPTEGMRMVGAHTDSPCLLVKPSPEKVKQGYLQLGVEVYGGALLNPWFDRDLSLAGRVSYRCSGGTLRSALLDYREPIATIPSLAIHLDREANKQRKINPQTDILPVLCQPEAGDTSDFRDYLKQRLLSEHPDCAVEQVLDYEMAFYDTQPPAQIGLQKQFIASARLDNLLSCFTGLQSLLASDGKYSSLLICNDHEEVGSASAAGAQGPLLQSVLRQLAGSASAYAGLVERSMMISADNAHGVHPNYVDRHDDNHGPLLNAGPVIKINANQRYATNSETAGLVRMLADATQVPLQTFVVRTDMACGSTIGPITASEIGVRTMDIGVPTFGMHSIRELAGSDDAWHLQRLLRHFFDYGGNLAAQ